MYACMYVCMYIYIYIYIYILYTVPTKRNGTIITCCKNGAEKGGEKNINELLLRTYLRAAIFARHDNRSICFGWHCIYIYIYIYIYSGAQKKVAISILCNSLKWHQQATFISLARILHNMKISRSKSY